MLRTSLIIKYAAEELMVPHFLWMSRRLSRTYTIFHNTKIHQLAWHHLIIHLLVHRSLLYVGVQQQLGRASTRVPCSYITSTATWTGSGATRVGGFGCSQKKSKKSGRQMTERSESEWINLYHRFRQIRTGSQERKESKDEKRKYN